MILKLYFKFLFFLDIYKDILFVCVWGGGVIFKIRIFSLAWLNNTTTLV